MPLIGCPVAPYGMWTPYCRFRADPGAMSGSGLEREQRGETTSDERPALTLHTVGPPDCRSTTTARQRQFEIFFRDHHEAAIRYGLRRGLDDGDAKEVAADALRIVWQKCPDFDDRAIPFLYRTCRNLLMHAYRARQRRSEVEERIREQRRFELDRGDQPDDGQRVREALESLGDPGAELLRLLYWDGLTAAQAAEALGRTEQAAWALASRSRKKLARILEGRS